MLRDANRDVFVNVRKRERGREGGAEVLSDSGKGGEKKTHPLFSTVLTHTHTHEETETRYWFLMAGIKRVCVLIKILLQKPVTTC